MASGAFTGGASTYLISGTSSSTAISTITCTGGGGGGAATFNGSLLTGITVTDMTIDTVHTGISRIRGVAQPGETIELPDGSKLVLDQAGNYRIEDKNAKVTYRANRLREFNPFLNASDLLADFVRDLGAIGLPNDAIMRAPIDLFIHWLVVRAAEQDGDPINEKQCRRCGRFVSVNRRRLGACGPDHVPLLPPRKHFGAPRLVKAGVA